MKPRTKDKRFGSPYGKGEPLNIKRPESFRIIGIDELPWLFEEQHMPISELERRLQEAERLMRESYLEEIREENELIKRAQREALNFQPFRIQPNYQQRKLPPPPTHYLIQFIGGPFNSTQDYVEVKPHDGIANGARYKKVDAPPIDANYDILNPPPVQLFTYRLTFIPMDETPFSDAQVIVAVFQE